MTMKKKGPGGNDYLPMTTTNTMTMKKKVPGENDNLPMTTTNNMTMKKKEPRRKRLHTYNYNK